MYKAIIVMLIVIWAWIVYEFYTAPCMDDDGNIKPGKKLSDLFKRKKHGNK